VKDEGASGSISISWRKFRFGRHLSNARNRVVLFLISTGGGRVCGCGRAEAPSAVRREKAAGSRFLISSGISEGLDDSALG